VFGVRPGNPFLFTIAATGDCPMKFSVENLPPSLALDAKTGQITGILTNRGETVVTLHAENAVGKAESKFRIICGDTIALTPPMGWNSWNCFAAAVDDAKVRAAADAMVSSGLINHGWTYINIDDCWEGDRDANGFIQPNKKFPNMKALADYIHSKGLKFGIYSSPGPETCAKFAGSYGYEDKDAQRYKEWGVDYVKYDSCSYRRLARQLTVERYAKLLPANDAENLRKLSAEKEPLDANRNRSEEQTARLKQINSETKTILQKINPTEKEQIDLELLQAPYRVFRASLDKVNRDIVYSICQYGKGNVWEWGEKLGGNSWRTTEDIKDTWKSLSDIGFSQAGHEKYAGPGHWNDPDMLIVGLVGWGENLHPSRLTPDEPYMHISLWSLLCSPLLIGCDMSRLDEFTLSLLSNDEVLEVNQDPLGKQAGRISKDKDLEVWAKEMEDGSKAVGLFNLGQASSKVSVEWSELGIHGQQIVRDLWRQTNLGAFDNHFEAVVAPHGVVLVRIRPASK
jgi:alpha-galactosidase